MLKCHFPIFSLLMSCLSRVRYFSKDRKLLICQYIFLQAGGHAKLIQIGNGYVGKPLIPREAEMYRLRPQKIAPFMPEFKGKLFAHC